MPGQRVLMFVMNPMTHDTRVAKEAATLSAAGHDVTVVAVRRRGLPDREALDEAEIVRVPDDPAPARLARAILARLRGAEGAGQGAVITREAVGRPGLRARLTGALLELHLRLVWRKYVREAMAAARERPAEVWIAHDLETLPLALRARDALGGRVLYDSHELFVESSMARGRPGRWRRVEERLIGQADAVVTVNASIADELESRYGISRPEVVLNTPAASAGHPTAPVDLRSEAGLAAGLTLALYLGGIQPGRGLERLVEVAAHDEGLAVVLLGPGPAADVARIERLALEAGVAERFRLLPPVPAAAVRAWAAGADVGVTLPEATNLNNVLSLPNKLFDYLQAGLPVVVSDFPELRALIEREQVGAVCDPTDAREIAAAIRRVASAPELRANAREAGRVYTWGREGEKLLRIVEDLTRG